jgi:alpha-glucosidase (family GH31 glycosyl hydrolase)
MKRAILLGATFAMFVACDESFPTETPMVISSPAARVEVRLRPFSLALYDKDGALVTQTLRDLSSDDPNGTVAATFDAGKDGIGAIPGWDGYQPLEGAWEHGNEAILRARDDAHASVTMQTANGHIDVDVTIDGNKITIHQLATGHAPGDATQVWNKTTMGWQLRATDHFFGLGERFATMDHRGWSLFSWSEEGGLGGGEDSPPRAASPPNPEPNGPSMTYFPVPFILTPQGWAMHLDTTRRTETHFGSERDDAWRVAINANELTTVVYVNDDPMKSIDDFTRDTGRPHVPAPWVFGPRRRVSLGQVASFPPGTPPQDETLLLRQYGVATTTIDDATHFLPHSSQIGREAALAGWTSSLHSNGYKATCYNTPFVSADDPNSADILQEGTAKGYFLMDPATGKPGITYFSSGKLQNVVQIDLTNPDAVTFFQNLLRRSLALGYDGWMHDFGEYTRRGWTAHDGTNGETLHNLFPVLSAKAAHDLLEVERPNDYLFYVRSGYTGSTQYASTGWSGDPEATFDWVQGLPAMVRGGLNLGMSGFPIWGSDTSGYKCLTAFPRDKEVYLRWAQYSAVCPIMEEENACSSITDPNAQKWKLWNDQETVTVVGAMQRLHTRLQPYFMLLANLAHETGAPIMLHPMLLFPKEQNAWAIDDAFFVGRSLYTSPVVHRGVTSKTTWMPPGRYVALDDSSVLEGGKMVTFPAPVDRLPLFVVENQMVPMLDPSIDTLAPAPSAGVVSPDKVADRLDVVVAIGPGGHAAITLADGTQLTADRGMPQGNQSNLATVTADDIASCSGCVVVNAEGGVSRVRVTTPLLPTSNLTYDDMTLIASGPTARRIRWDVRRLP